MLCGGRKIPKAIIMVVVVGCWSTGRWTKDRLKEKCSLKVISPHPPSSEQGGHTVRIIAGQKDRWTWHFCELVSTRRNLKSKKEEGS